MITSTPFKKEDFHFDGMYLMYHGDAGVGSRFYIAGKTVHPSREKTQMSTFVARFKNGSKPWKSFVNALVKNSTVEEMIVAYENGVTPLDYAVQCGYKPKPKARRV